MGQRYVKPIEIKKEYTRKDSKNTISHQQNEKTTTSSFDDYSSEEKLTDTLYNFNHFSDILKPNTDFKYLHCMNIFDANESFQKSKSIPREKDVKIDDLKYVPNCHPFHKIVNSSKIDPEVTKADSSPEGYTPSQIRAAYGLNNVTGTGKGQKIAIICAYVSPTVVNDFITFDRTFNISPSNINPATYLTVHTANGAIANNEWSYEINLDVQWAHAVAPQAQIHLYQAKSAYLSDLLPIISRAINDGSTIISMSWGCNEFNGQNYYSQYFRSNKNVVFLAASGDTAGTVAWPSSEPTVLSVGGTTLSLDSFEQRISEVGWNQSGGGTSKYNIIPLWQYVYGLRGKRQTPDISLAANTSAGFPVYLNGSWVQLIGTSVSTPIVAGIFALINEKRTAKLKKSLTYSSTLYYLYNLMGRGLYYAINFNDIISGTSGSNKTKIGFDNVTGLGSGKNTSNTKGFVYSLFNL